MLLKHAAVCAIAALFAPLSAVRADSLSLGGLDICKTTLAQFTGAYSTGPLQLQSTAVQASIKPSAFGNVPQFDQTDNYKYSLSQTIGGNTTNFGNFDCTVGNSYQIRNSPGGSTAGSTVPDQDIDPADVPGWLQQFFQSATNLLHLDDVQTPPPDTPYPYAGIRASIDIPGGITLAEASPAYFSFQPAAPLTGTLAVPFIVEAPGIGDSLSMYYGGTQFFKQPLANFTVGQLYFAALTVPAGPATNPAIMLWLDSAGANGAKVFIPTSATLVPLPPAGLLFAAALGFIGIRRRGQAS